MDEEDKGWFDITPGKVWMVPIKDGEISGEPFELKPIEGFTFDWGEDRDVDPGLDPGQDGGLDGGLQGGLDGALSKVGLKWEVEFELQPGQITEEVQALFWGMTVAEYRDWVQWIDELRWLKKVTGLSWGLT